ncbi:MAG TPA: hypothetical protein VF041_13120 [Gemmatimonadaceae bacterium]
MIGILVVVLIALVVFFYWRGTGARDAEGHHPTNAEMQGPRAPENARPARP